MEKISATIYITNKCNLRCKHCFFYREGNPNIPEEIEMSSEKMITEILRFKKKYDFLYVIWLGGEPLLRKDVLELGVNHFLRNVITTNGTLSIPNLNANVLWLVSLDGNEVINDEIRGKGVFKRVIHTLNNLPDDFTNEVQCHPTLSKKNENYIEELMKIIQKETPIKKILFTFYISTKNDTSEFAWKSLKERDVCIKRLIKLKKKNPIFIRNTESSLKSMLSQNALFHIGEKCWSRKNNLPLFLGENGFEITYCCYGNHVRCDLCGSSQVFYVPSII